MAWRTVSHPASLPPTTRKGPLGWRAGKEDALQSKGNTPLSHSGTCHIPENLRGVAANHCLKLRRDECGDPVIPGSRGQIYAYDDAFLAVLLLFSSKRAWTHGREKLLATGFTLLQECDTEGTATFDPQNREQVALAIKIAGAKKRRRVSTETVARLASFAKSRRAIAGTALPATETRIGLGGYVRPHPNERVPLSGSAAMKRAHREEAQ
jgi:hypothetical protein